MKRGTGRVLLGFACHLLAATALTAPALAQNSTKTTNRWGAHADVTGEASTLDSSGGVSFFVPLFQNDNALLFVDANLNSGFDSSVYGSFAAGYRQIMGNGAILGGFVSFDALSQDGRQYSAVGFGAEILGDRLEARMNAQIPISGSYQLPIPGAITAGSTLSLVDNALIEAITTGVATREEIPQTRIEGEVGVKLPLDFSGSNDELKVFGGAYFLHGSGQDDLFGVSARVEYAVREPFGDSLPGSKLFLGATAKYDRENKLDFGAQVRLSVPIGAAAGSADPGIDDRMTHHLVRTNKIATRIRSVTTLSTTERVAVNPDGDEYNSIYFADGDNSLGAGTQADPTTLADAVTQAGTDGIIVAEGNNGVINTGGVTLQNGQQVLGGGTAIPVRLDDNSIVNFTLGVAAGQIQGVPAANIINLGLDNVLRNFSLDGGLAGIAGDAVGTLVLDNLTISNTAGSGLDFTAASGTVTGTGISITGAGGAGLRIDGGSAVFDIAGVINHNAAGPTGAAVEINGSSGNVTVSSAITSTSGRSVAVTNLAGGAVVFSGSIVDTGSGILLQNNSSGSTTFSGPVTLNTGVNDALTMDTNTGHTVTFTGGLDIDTTTGAGLTAINGGTLNIAASAGNNTINTAGGRGILIGTGLGISTSTGINLDSVTSTAMGAVTGIEIDGLSGAGAFTLGSATITGVEVIGISLTDITSAGAFTISDIDIGGISGVGLSSSGGHTTTLNLGSGAGGVSVDGTETGASFSGTHSIVNLGTGAGGLQLGVNAVINGDGVLFAADSTGTFNVGTASLASRILVTGGSATADGIHYQNSDATVTLTNIHVEQAGGHGLFIEDDDATGQFTLTGSNSIDAVNLDGIRIAGANASISGVTIGASSAPAGNGVTVTDSGQDIVVALDSINVTSVGGTGISLDGTGGGSLTVASFANNTVTRALAGVFADTVTFDADGGTAGGGDADFTGDTVSGGNLNIGQGDTIVGAGVALNNVSGDLSFGAVNVTSNGTGLDITGSGSFNAVAGTGFRLATTSGTINSVNSSGVLFDPFTADVTLTSISSGGGVNGILLDQIDGSFTVTGAVTVNGATGDGISLINNGATVNFQGMTTINSAGGNGIGLSGNSGTVSFGTANIDAPTGNGIDISGSNGATNFGNVGITNLGATTGLDLSGATLNGALNIGSLAITGTGAAGSIGIDLRGLQGNPIVNAGSVSGTISNVQVGVFIGNDTAAQFTFGDGGDVGDDGDTGSSISVIAGGYTVDASAGTVIASSFDFDDVVLTGNANFPTSGADYLFVSTDGADTSGGFAAEGTEANPYTAAEADLLTTAGLNFIFLDGTYDFGAGTTLVAGGTFLLDSGQTAQALDLGNSITYGTAVPANITGAFSAIGGTISGSGSSFTNATGGAVFTLAGSNVVSFLTVDGDAAVDPSALFVSNGGLAGFDNSGGIMIEGVTAGNVSAGNSVFDFTDMTGSVTIRNNAVSISDGTLLAISGGSASYTVTAGTIPNSVTPGTLSATGAATGADIQGTTGGSVTVTGLNSQGTGSALLADDNDASISFTGLTAINHGANTVFDIDTGAGGSTGAISFDSTSAFSSGNTGTIFEIGAGSRDIDADAVNIVVSGATREVIDIAGQSGGTISFGDVTYDGAGAAGSSAIRTAGMTGGTLSFGAVDIGSTTAFNNAAGTAVNLTGTGGSVSFTSLDITADDGNGLTAGGIGLSVAGTASSIVASSGQALDLNGTVIGGGGITLASVTSSGSASTGISAQSVTGDGLTLTTIDIDTTGGDGVLISGNGAATTINGGTVDGTTGNAITISNAPASISGVTFGGSSPIGGAGISITNNDATSRSVTLSGLTSATTGAIAGEGVAVSSTGTGTLSLSLQGSTIRSTDEALITSDGGTAGQLVLDLGSSSGNTFERGTAGSTVSIAGGALNSTIVSALGSLTVTGNGTAGGVRFNQVSFDASGAALAATAVNATGTMQIGQDASNRVSGDGLRFDLPTGTLNLGTLTIFNDSGTGLYVDTKTGGPTIFTLSNSVVTSSIDTTNGSALFLDPLSADLTFDAVSSTNSATTGVTFDEVTGVGAGGTPNAVTIGTLTVTGATGTSVLVDTSSGSFSLGNTTISGGGGAGISIVGGSAVVTASGSSSLTQAANAAAVSVSGGHTGSLTYSGTINATDGTGLQFNNADGSQYNFNNAVTLNGGDAGVDIINGSSASFTFGNLTITNPTGTAFNIDNSSGAITYSSGSITKTNNSASAFVANNAGGGIRTIGVAITATTGTAAAVNIANSGGVFNFTGGLGITTTAGAGFSASGGGTVTVQGTGNTVTTTTGTAVNIANTTIGADGVRFLSVSANGATNGIVLNTTGTTGAFSVTGTGTTLASGGTIQNTTGSGVLLTNARGVSLTNMDITTTGLHGIEGTTVTNLDLTRLRITNAGNAANENGINLTNLLGTTAAGLDSRFDTIVITGAADNGIEVNNTTATNAGASSSPDLLTVTNSSILNSAAGGIQFISGGGNGNMRLDVNGASVFTNNAAVGIAANANGGIVQLNVTGANQFIPGAGTQFRGISGGATGAGQLFFNIDNNTITQNGSTGTGPSAIAFATFDTATMNGTILNNTISSTMPAGTTVSGISVINEGSGSNAVIIDNNTITITDGFGIIGNAQGLGTGLFGVTVTNNIIDVNGPDVANTSVSFTNSGTVGQALCVNVANNTLTTTPGGNFDITLSNSPSGTFLVQGLGASDNTAPDFFGNTQPVEVYLSGLQVNLVETAVNPVTSVGGFDPGFCVAPTTP